MRGVRWLLGRVEAARLDLCRLQSQGSAHQTCCNRLTALHAVHLGTDFLLDRQFRMF